MRKVAIITSPDLPIPPFAGYGGIQRGIYDLLSEFSQYKQYQFFLFAAGDSDVSLFNNIKLFTNLRSSLWRHLLINNTFYRRTQKKITFLKKQNLIKEQAYVDFIYKKLQILKPEKILFIYDNLKLLKILLKQHLFKDKVIYCLRNPANKEKIEFLKNNLNLRVTALSDSQKKNYGNLSNIKVIKWGVDIKNYQFSPTSLASTKEKISLKILKFWKKKKIDYLAIVSAIGYHKGQKTAMEIAERSNLNLIIAGTPQDRSTLRKTNYFLREIKPRLSEKIIYYGNVNERKKIEILKFAKASLAPFGVEMSEWKEPFGRVIIESLACGTPVIGYKNGALPEIISNNLNGFLFSSIPEALNATNSLNGINRYLCRKTIQKKFNIKRVAQEYKKLLDLDN